MARQDTFEGAFARFIEDFMDEQERFKYDQAISEMIVKGSKSLIIDFTDLYTFDMDLARSILENPEGLNPIFNTIIRAKLRTRDPLYAESIKRINVRFHNLPSVTQLRKIGADHIGMLHYDFPLMLGSNIISNLRYILSNDINTMIPSLTFTAIPFSNATLPGTINPSSICSPKNESVKLKPIKVKGKSKSLPLYTQKISGDVILNEIKFYERILDDVNPHFNFLDKRKVKVFTDLVKSISHQGETFNDQAIFLSYNAWCELFDFEVGPQFLLPIEDFSKSLTKQSISMNLLEKRQIIHFQHHRIHNRQLSTKNSHHY